MQNLGNKTVPLFEKYVSKIESGLCGDSGSKFLTVREFAAKENISLVTSQKVFSLLEEYGVIKCFNKKYYLSYGRMSSESSLTDLLNKRAAFLTGKVMGIIVPDLKNPFFSALLQKISVYAIKANFFPLVMSYHGDEKLETEIVDLLVSMGAKGIITCPNSNKSVKNLYSKCVLPVVFISKKFSIDEEHYSSADNYNAAKRVAKHFIEMGYENFMYIGNDIASDEDMRYKGFFDELENLGIEVSRQDNAFLLKENFTTLPYHVCQKITAAKKPLGIFCYHDIISERVLSACKSANLSIPDEVGIVGFDDLPITTQVEPALSTIAYSFDEMAKTAVKKLIKQINRTADESDNTIKPINHTLIVRDSSRRKK